MPLFMLKRKFFEQCKSGEKDVELHACMSEDKELMAFELVQLHEMLSSVDYNC